MLVLSRKLDEVIEIGDSVKVTVIDIRGDKVRLGIEAPPDVAVHREEVAELIRKQGAVAPEANTAGTHDATGAATPD